MIEFREDMHSKFKATDKHFFLIFAIEIVLLIFSLWTFSFHLFFTLSLPAGLLVVPALLIGILVATSIYISRKQLIDSIKKDKKILIALAPLLILLAVFSLVVARPDNDDFSHYHHVLYQLDHLDQPLVSEDTSHGERGLPPISYMHILSSYESFCSLVSYWFGIDPLWFYQNAMLMFNLMILCIVLFLLFREFRIRWPLAILSCFVSFLFLLSDGNAHLSLGVITLARMWQGKVIIWGLFASLTLLLAKQYLRRPGWRRLTRVFLLMICAAGLSNGMVLAPLMMAAISIAYLVSFGFTKKRFYSVFKLCLTIVYPAAFALMFLTGIIPSPSNTDAWINFAKTDWYQNLFRVIGTNESLVRNLLILFLLPFTSLQKPFTRFVPILTLVIILLYANPLTGPILLTILTSGFYFRIMYLFPLAFSAGLIGNALFNKRPIFNVPHLRIATAVIVAASIIYASDHNVINQPVRPAELKSPFDYRFTGDTYKFNKQILPELHNKYILAPQRITIEAGLLNHRLHFYANRRAQTKHIFLNAEKPVEAHNRVYAEILVSQFEQDKILNAVKPRAALQEALKAGVNAVIAKISSAQKIQIFQTILASSGDTWEIAAKDFGFVLWLKR